MSHLAHAYACVCASALHPPHGKKTKKRSHPPSHPPGADQKYNTSLTSHGRSVCRSMSHSLTTNDVRQDRKRKGRCLPKGVFVSPIAGLQHYHLLLTLEAPCSTTVNLFTIFVHSPALARAPPARPRGSSPRGTAAAAPRRSTVPPAEMRFTASDTVWEVSAMGALGRKGGGGGVVCCRHCCSRLLVFLTAFHLKTLARCHRREERGYMYGPSVTNGLESTAVLLK